jgi:flavin-dependent dehydrogenase
VGLAYYIRVVSLTLAQRFWANRATHTSARVWAGPGRILLLLLFSFLFSVFFYILFSVFFFQFFLFIFTFYDSINVGIFKMFGLKKIQIKNPILKWADFKKFKKNVRISKYTKDIKRFRF